MAISISILCTEAPTARRRAAQARADSPAAISSNPEGGCGSMREQRVRVGAAAWGSYARRLVKLAGPSQG